MFLFWIFLIWLYSFRIAQYSFYIFYRDFALTDYLLSMLRQNEMHRKRISLSAKYPPLDFFSFCRWKSEKNSSEECVPAGEKGILSTRLFGRTPWSAPKKFPHSTPLPEGKGIRVLLFPASPMEERQDMIEKKYALVG